jgi:hypothetical protein
MLGSDAWLPARRVWRGASCDAALLYVAAVDAGDDPCLVLGRLRGEARAACRALGFPFAQAKQAGAVRDTEDLAGEIAPLTALKSGLVTLHVAGSVPVADRSGHSPWEGMSGAAVFSGPLIVGVVVVDPAHFGTDRLQAVPVAAMISDPGFREALTGDAGAEVVLPAVEDVDVARGVLRAPYRPLPAKATPQRLRDGATHFLVAAEYGIVPFRGRTAELVDLERWCASDAGLELGVVLGAGGTGKTRLAAELCRRVQARGSVAGFLETGASRGAVSALATVTAPLLVVVDEAPARLADVVTLLVRLADSSADSPLRVLLLARRGGEWWERVLPQRLAGHSDAEFVHATARVEELGAVDATATRLDAFRAAAGVFAQRMGREDDEPTAPDLDQPLFEQILFVHLAALFGA